jgi:single-strand DNA-binding protein
MASFNRVILLGNLTRDPELRYIPSGAAVCDLGLAVNDRRKGKDGEWIEDVTFVDVTLWQRAAEVASEYLSKGSPVLIEGRLKLDTWQGQDGQKRSKLRVIAEKMQMLGNKGGAGGGGNGQQRPPQQQQSQQSYQPQQDDRPPDNYNEAPPADGDIPF